MDGIGLIQAERDRQKNVEGWTPEHDDEHDRGQLSEAGSCYADLAAYQSRFPEYAVDDRKPMGWPWSGAWWKPSDDPIRNLVKAGALIAAEIDRLQRMNAKSVTSSPEQEEEVTK